MSDWLESWEKKILPPPATPYTHAQMTAIADALAFGTPWPENQDYAEAKARYYNQWGKIHAMAAGEEKTGATTVTDNRALDYVVGLIDGARLWNGKTGKAAAQGYIEEPVMGRRSGGLSDGKKNEVVNFPILAAESSPYPLDSLSGVMVWCGMPEGEAF